MMSIDLIIIILIL